WSPKPSARSASAARNGGGGRSASAGAPPPRPPQARTRLRPCGGTPQPTAARVAEDAGAPAAPPPTRAGPADSEPLHRPRLVVDQVHGRPPERDGEDEVGEVPREGARVVVDHGPDERHREIGGVAPAGT